MQDKNYDDFFDEKTIDESPQEKLMTLVDTAKTGSSVQLKAGAITKGTIHSIGKEFIFVDIGQKNEAVIKNTEFLDNEGNIAVKIGDTVTAYIISTNNDEIVMSRSFKILKAGTKDLINAMKDKIPIEGKVTGINKGGFNVTIMGKKAFCPFSHINLKYVNEPNKYLSKMFEFVITKVENRGRNIVLSRLPLLEKDLEEKIDALEKHISEKTIITGIVSKISKFGLFVDLGDVEGLVHVSEVSWERAQTLADSFIVGQKIDCVILKIEKTEPLRNSKISLSIRMAGENPWKNISEKLQTGSLVEGTIQRLTKFGAFVQLLPGIEGLIHISEMSWGKRIRHPSDVVSEGQNVKVTILSIDEEKRSVSCSLKDIGGNPWKSITEKYPVGSKTAGTISSETKYGFFVDLDEDITGLLVHSKINKSKKGTFKKGDTIEVDVEEIDIENCRISLSYGLAGEQPKEDNYNNHKKELKAPKMEAHAKSSSEFGDLLKAAMNKKK